MSIADKKEKKGFFSLPPASDIHIHVQKKLFTKQLRQLHHCNYCNGISSCQHRSFKLKCDPQDIRLCKKTSSPLNKFDRISQAKNITKSKQL